MSAEETVNNEIIEHPDATVPDGRTPSSRPAEPIDVVKRFADQRAAETAAADKVKFGALAPAEKQIALLRKSPAFLNPGHADHQKVMVQFRRAVEAAATPEERDTWETSSLAEKRQSFDMPPPTLPPSALAGYEEAYGWAETDLMNMAKNEGLPSATVRGLRDAAVNLAMQVDGRPLPDEVVDAALKKFALTDAQRAQFKKLYRAVEGGGATS